MPGMKEWDIFAPSPNLGVAQRCLAAYTEHIADRPAALAKFGFQILTGKRPSISITGVQPGCDASWAERLTANFGKNPLGPLFGLSEAQHILKIAVSQPPVHIKFE